MSLRFERIAVVGATGPTGRELVAQLAAIGQRVRAVSRRLDVLTQRFPAAEVEKREGDALDLESLSSAIDGCDLVIDCIGLPSEQMADHPKVARTLASAIARSGARCLQVSSYWSFIPIGSLPIAETSPREGGPSWARWRREAEDVLLAAGAAVVHLPDFFGPHVHTSTLQLPLKDAVAGKPMNWIGGAEVKRDYIFVPDAMRTVSRLVAYEEAYAKHWVLAGCGPVSAVEVADHVSRILGRAVKVRAAGPLLLRLVSLFQRELRGFMSLVPTYVQPVRFDARRIEQLLGPLAPTPYVDALAQTIAGLRSAGRR